MSKPTETTNDRVPRDLVRFGKHTDCREASGSVGVWFGEASGNSTESLPKRAGTRNGAHAGRGVNTFGCVYMILNM